MRDEADVPKDNAPGETVPPPSPYDSTAIHRARELLESVPERIGPYRILERIGGGGMGDVYVAEQSSPIKRRVALKVIKAGMDTRQVVARFEAERQALAMMDHPNIARVFDAGTTETGRPYFVMELVRGVPITQFCDEQKLTTRQRVELLIPVCHAVQHAHQKGIIHRDIKPTNVLVTLHDGVPVPKVIDFGIAKATSQPLTDKTVYTEFRQMIGTPAYMSPEQAEMSGLDIDTRCDIYSIGVVAYELLTGTTPFETTRLVKAGLMEIQRIIREEEPPRPSLRISSLGQTLPTVAAQRGIEAGRLGRLVAGELDWIVMRAMEKDRNRRYATTNDLAADLQRHLQGEPIIAAPPSTTYRVRKFARRHKVALSAVSSVAILLGIGGAGTLTQMLRAQRAEQETLRQRDQLRGQAGRVNDALANLVTGTFAPAPGGTGMSSFGGNANQEGWTLLFRHSLDGTKTLRVLTGNVDAGRIDVLLDQPQPPVNPGTLLDALSSTVIDATYKLQEKTNAAETAAYIANLALGQAAMLADRWSEARQRFNACPESKRGWEWKFLMKRASSVERSMEVPGRDAVVSPDGKTLCTRDGWALYLNEVASDRELCDTVRVPDDPNRDHVRDGPVAKAVFSPDSRRLAVSTESAVHQYDLLGKAVAPPLAHDRRVVTVEYARDGKSILTVTDDGTTRRWDLSGRLLSQTHAVADKPSTTLATPVRDVVWSNGVGVAYARYGAEISLIDTDGRCLGTNRPLTRYRFLDPVFIPGTRKVLVASGNGDMFVDVAYRDVIDLDHFDSPSDWFGENVDLEAKRLLEVSASGSVPAATQPVREELKKSGDGSGVRVVRGGVELCTVPTGRVDLEQCALSPDASRLVSSVGDEWVRFWDARTGRELVAVRAGGRVKGLRFTPDGSRLIIDYGPDRMEVWDTRDYADRQKDRDARFAEIPAAKQYVQKLLATDTPADKLKDAVRGDTALPVLRKLAALAEVDHELSRIEGEAQGWYAKLNVTSVFVGIADDIGEIADPRVKHAVLAKARESDMNVLTLARQAWRRASHPGDSAERYQEAIEIATRAVEQLRAPLTLRALGTCLYRAGKYDRALKALLESEKLSVDTAVGPQSEAWAFIAMCYRAQTRDEEAADALKKAVALRNVFFGECVVEAIESIAPGTAAEVLAKREGKLSSKSCYNIQAWNFVRLPSFSAEQYRYALRVAEVAVACAPGDPYVLNTLGIAQYRAGEYAKAISTLGKSDELNQNGSPGSLVSNQIFMAMAQFRLGHLETAKKSFKQALSAMKSGGDGDDAGFRDEAASLIDPASTQPASQPATPPPGR